MRLPSTQGSSGGRLEKLSSSPIWRCDCRVGGFRSVGSWSAAEPGPVAGSGNEGPLPFSKANLSTRSTVDFKLLGPVTGSSTPDILGKPLGVR